MRAVLLPVLLLAACSQQPSPNKNIEVDLNGAADRAQNDTDTYGANDAATNGAVAPPVAGEAPLAPAEPGQPGGLPDDRTPLAEGKIAPDSAQGAANIVQIYYASIEGGKYDAARALWGDNGAASKLSPAAFAANFARYKEYHANIGGPGAVEGAAGSRYVAVPVQVYARLKDGRPEYQLGKVVLRRSEVDGATPDQRKWHIQSIDLKPAPGKAVVSTPAGPGVVAARYRCMDGSKLAVRFDNTAGTAALNRNGKPLAVLAQQPSGSGIRYGKGPFELRGKGDAATLTTPGQPPIACTVIH